MAGVNLETQLIAGFTTFIAGLTLLYQYRRYQDPHSTPRQARYPDLVTLDQELQTAGRSVGIAQYGSASPGIRTVVFFHGLPGSRIVPVPSLRESCIKHNIHLIAVERPGVGLTTPADDAKSSFELSSQDVRQVLRAVLGEKLEQPVAVIGYSMGGPLALRFVYDFPDLVDRLYLIGTAGFDTLPKNAKFDEKWQPVLHGHRLEDEVTNTPNRVAQSLARYTPSVLSAFWTMMAPSMVHEDDYIDNVLQSTSPEDRARLTEENVDLWKITGRETFRQGISGMLRAILEIFGKSPPDGFGWNVAKVKDQVVEYDIEVHLYAAKSDVFVPVSVVVGMADVIGATPKNFTLYGDDIGHLGLLDRAMADVLRKEGRLTMEEDVK